MDPLFEYRDEQPSLKFLLIVVGIALLAMAVFMPSDPKLSYGAMVALRVMFVFFAGLTFLSLPVIVLRAYDDHIEIRYGIGGLVKFSLSNEKITWIEAVEYSPLKDFGGWGIKGGYGDYRGWWAFTASITSRALAIETTEKNYLVGCRNPSEAETMLRNIVGVR